MNKIEVAVYMPDEKAKQFLAFQQYYEPISILLERKVFEQKNATISLFFDHQSVLQTVQRKDYVFSRKFDVIPSFD